MSTPPLQIHDQVVVKCHDLQRLFDALVQKGYQVVGPMVRDGAVVHEPLTSAADLPAGWTDEQTGGSYRLKRRKDQAVFGHAAGPHSWKRFLFPPIFRLWQAQLISKQAGRNGAGFQISAENDQPPLRAFLGVHPCDLRAMEVQDKVFMNGAHEDRAYRLRRKNLAIIAVNCTQPGGTCFCASMGAGPKAVAGFDLALTEMIEGDAHFFLTEIGTETGAEILRNVPHREAVPEEKKKAEGIMEEAAGRMGRTMDAADLRELLYRNREHPRWGDVATRCLTCANCTMACPTCFCSTVEDVTDLTGDHAGRWRKWDSCFTMDFSHIHGGSVRSSAKARYRQWMTHKLAAWQDQFGICGCVGCGRCITWCPVGIDITEEVRAIRATQTASKEKSRENN